MDFGCSHNPTLPRPILLPGLLSPLQLDHVFICCDVDAPEAGALTRLGLVEGSRNTHSGQGTANRFFFRGGFVELLWVADAAEAQGERTAPTRLWPRWSQRNSGSCPFGIAFSPAGSAVVAPTFDAWDYTPAYLPPGKVIRFARGTRLQEPELFYLAWPSAKAATASQPVDHAVPLLALTSVSVGLPTSVNRSPGLQAAVASGLVGLHASPRYQVRLEFNAPEAVLFDFPELRLVLRGSPDHETPASPGA